MISVMSSKVTCIFYLSEMKKVSANLDYCYIQNKYVPTDDNRYIRYRCVILYKLVNHTIAFITHEVCCVLIMVKHASITDMPTTTTRTMLSIGISSKRTGYVLSSKSQEKRANSASFPFSLTWVVAWDC